MSYKDGIGAGHLNELPQKNAGIHIVIGASVATNRELLKTLIEKDGVEANIVVFSSGQELLDYYTELVESYRNATKFVIMNKRLAEVNGLGVVDGIRKIEQKKKITNGSVAHIAMSDSDIFSGISPQVKGVDLPLVYPIKVDVIRGFISEVIQKDPVSPQAEGVLAN